MASFEPLSSPRPNYCPVQWYRMADEKHFWFQWRLRVFMNQLRDLDLLGRSFQCLDVGCGNGLLRRQIEKHTAWTIDGTDIYEGILAEQGNLRGKTYLYDIDDRRKELQEAYDGLFLFDILEHLDNPVRFLHSALFHLRPKGWVFINVPALPFLYSAYDVMAEHVKRYDPMLLGKELQKAFLENMDSRYWGLSLIPALGLRKLLLRKPNPSTLRHGFKPFSETIHTILKGLMAMETRWIGKPFRGTSLMVAAQKKES
jgi:SAM-dependent methyltransferase